MKNRIHTKAHQFRTSVSHTWIRILVFIHWIRNVCPEAIHSGSMRNTFARKWVQPDCTIHMTTPKRSMTYRISKLIQQTFTHMTILRTNFFFFFCEIIIIIILHVCAIPLCLCHVFVFFYIPIIDYEHVVLTICYAIS